jgi:hypothetical protein
MAFYTIFVRQKREIWTTFLSPKTCKNRYFYLKNAATSQKNYFWAMEGPEIVHSKPFLLIWMAEEMIPLEM